VEFDRNGRLLSCVSTGAFSPDEVTAAAPRKKSKWTFRVSGNNREEAVRLARVEFDAVKATARRAAFSPDGHCKCGRALPRPRDPQSPFLAKQAEEKAAAKAPVVVVGTSVSEARAQLLEQVYEKFHDLTMSRFGAWLNAELEKTKPPKRQASVSSSTRGAVFSHHKLRVVGGK